MQKPKAEKIKKTSNSSAVAEMGDRLPQ